MTHELQVRVGNLTIYGTCVVGRMR